MAHIVEISDGVLINNLYRMLYNELGEVGFRDIFVEMGVATNVKMGEIGADEVDKIRGWIERQNTQDDEKIKLLKSLEKFRKISDDKNQFENQLKIVKEIYSLVIKNMIIYAELQEVLKPLTDEGLIEKLEKFQEHALEVTGFRRDNIVHQFRVFMLGCYILYEDKDFWVDHFRTDLTKIFREKSLGNLKLEEYAKYIDFMYVLAVWMISSLFHDYGKVIEDAQKEFKCVKDAYNEVINNLPLLEKISFNIPLSPGNSIKLSEAEALLKKNLGTFVDSDIFQIIEASRGKNAKKKAERGVEKGEAELSHATVGSELLNYLLTSLQQTGSGERRIFYYLLMLASCIAIALHDNQEYFFCSSLTQLLVICDNIQEWNRITVIGNKEEMIFPCRRIYIKLEGKEDRGTRTKIIQVFIPYERPEDIIAQEIFKRRFNPEQIWRKNVKALKAAKDERAFNKLFQGGIELTVHILFNHSGDGCRLKIKYDGTVEYQRTNIYAEFLE